MQQNQMGQFGGYNPMMMNPMMMNPWMMQGYGGMGGMGNPMMSQSGGSQIGSHNGDQRGGREGSTGMDPAVG